MAPNGDKDPISNITDKLRSLFVAGGHPKNKNAMPPKMRFSIGYFLLARSMIWPVSFRRMKVCREMNSG